MKEGGQTPAMSLRPRMKRRVASRSVEPVRRATIRTIASADSRQYATSNQGARESAIAGSKSLSPLPSTTSAIGSMFSDSLRKSKHRTTS